VTAFMLDLAELRPGDRVLDVAAGTGDASLMAARRVEPNGYVLAVDVSANMLKRAQESAREAGLTGVETRVMNAEQLELEADSFDAIICRSALMLFPSPTAALGEMRRVVKPNGRVSVMVHSTPENNPYHSLPLEIVRRIGRVAMPPRAQPGMFALCGAGVLERIYRQVGFRDVEIHPAAIRRRFSSLGEAIQSIKGSFAVLHDLMASLSEADRGRAWKEIEQGLSQFEGANGFEAPGEVIVGVGTK